MTLFLVLVMRRPQYDPAVVAAHRQFLAELRTDGRLERAGPFGDSSGGAYLLHAAGLEEARSIALGDPCHVSGGWDVSVYEWQAQ